MTTQFVQKDFQLCFFIIKFNYFSNLDISVGEGQILMVDNMSLLAL